MHCSKISFSLASKLTDEVGPGGLEFVDWTKTTSQGDFTKGGTGVDKGVASTERTVTHSH